MNEVLTKSFNDSTISARSELASTVIQQIDAAHPADFLQAYPTAVWLESRIALAVKESALVRNIPKTFTEITRTLCEDTGLDESACRKHLTDLMPWISAVNERNQDSRYSYLPFKLHQFFAQTGSVYTSLGIGTDRILTLEPGVFKGHDSDKKPIFPNVFSRTSGYAFICCYKGLSSGTLIPREFNNTDDEGPTMVPGYIIAGADVWDPADASDLLPESWFNVNKAGETSIAAKYRDRVPQQIWFDEWGNFSSSPSLPLCGWFMVAPLLFDPTSGQFFDAQTSEGTKLTRLGSEGRSTSTTITAFSILTRLADHGFDAQHQKLLSFTDNRQDAALQAGHFNDFIKVVRLRSAICKALDTAPDGRLTYKNLGDYVFDALNLSFREYANYKSDLHLAPPPTVQQMYREALKKYLVYLALYDLRRGWRVVLPNLEQCALLKVDYVNLDQIAAWKEAWHSVPVFGSLPEKELRHFLYCVLEFFRLEYAIYSENYLTEERIRQNQKEIEEKLIQPWKFEETDRIEPFHLRYDTLAPRTKLFTKSLGLTSALGKFIRQKARQIDSTFPLNRISYQQLLVTLLDTLEAADYLKSRPVRNSSNVDVKVYQLKLDKIVWLAGDRRTVKTDVIKQRSYKPIVLKPNEFFQRVYLTDFSQSKRLIGGDHTGQLSNDQRVDREERFRADGDRFKSADGTLNQDKVMRESVSALFCSPTMELGIDSRNLSIVHMRNAPPNPANYAQRSGRAGRSGQAALVFTYCSTFSNHDRHYFRHKQDMVAGSVLPPRIDLCNRELLTSHLNALFLSEVGLTGLDNSLLGIVDELAEGIPLKTSVEQQLKISPQKFAAIRTQFYRVVADILPELRRKGHQWFNDEWIDQTLASICKNLHVSMERWRRLYRQARATLSRATQEIESGTYSLGSKEYKQAKRNQDQATRQLDLLKNDQKGSSNQLSEFYPFRYLASEGFLPGYNFTRLRGDTRAVRSRVGSWATGTAVGVASHD